MADETTPKAPDDAPEGHGWLYNWLTDFLDWAIGILKTLANTLFTMMKDVFLWFFEQIMILVTFILQGMGELFQGLNVSQYFSGIPSDVAWVIGQTGLGEALGMIVAAITIRIFLQLIPFTRLGS